MNNQTDTCANGHVANSSGQCTCSTCVYRVGTFYTITLVGWL